MNLILLGAPGSGKGTQAENLVKNHGVTHISTGNIFREEIGKKSDLGLRVQEYLSSGRLVPDELTIEVVTSRLGRPDVRNGFLMDGFPRTVGQAEALDAYLSSSKQGLDAVISLEVSDEELTRRLLGRGREDDTLETIKKRLMVFHDLTQPLISYYSGQGLLRRIPGEGNIESIAQAIDAALRGANTGAR